MDAIKKIAIILISCGIGLGSVVAALRVDGVAPQLASLGLFVLCAFVLMFMLIPRTIIRALLYAVWIVFGAGLTCVTTGLLVGSEHLAVIGALVSALVLPTAAIAKYNAQVFEGEKGAGDIAFFRWTSHLAFAFGSVNLAASLATLNLFFDTCAETQLSMHLLNEALLGVRSEEYEPDGASQSMAQELILRVNEDCLPSDGWRVLGWALHTYSDDHSAVERVYAKALSEDPQDWFCVMQLGSLRQEQGRLEEARELFERAHRLQPLNLKSLASLLRLEIGEGRLGRAEELVAATKAAITADESQSVELDDLTRLSLAELYLGLRVPERALEELASVSVDELNGEARMLYWIHMTLAALEVGQSIKAAEAGLAAMQLPWVEDPFNDLSPFKNLSVLTAMAHFQAGEVPLARAFLQSAAAIAPEYRGECLYKSLLMLYEDRRRDVESRECVRSDLLSGLEAPDVVRYVNDHPKELAIHQDVLEDLRTW